jgi:hypothetical protein
VPPPSQLPRPGPARRVRLAPYDAAELDRAGLARVERVGHVVLLELTGAPAGHVQPAVVHRQVDVGDQRRHGAKGLQHRRQVVGVGGLGGDGDHLADRPAAAVLAPQPHRPREILDADDDADKVPGLGRVVRRSDLEPHLVLVAQVDALGELALGHAPEVQVVAELAAQQVLGVQAVLNHGRRGPLRGDDRVMVEVPPAVVAEELVAAIQLPRADDVERVVVQQRHAARAVVAVGVAQREHEDAAGPAVDGVGTGVAGLAGQLLGLDRADHPRVARVGLGVQHVRPRRADARDDQVAPL